MDATANQTGNTTFTVTSNAVEAATASTLVYRNASADINVRLLRANYQDQTTISGAIAYRVNNSSDNYTRYCSSPSAIRTFLGVPASGDLGNYLPLAGGIMTGDIGRSSSIEGFQVGSYTNVGDNSTHSNPIYTIGSSYNPALTTLGGMYGIGYTHANASFINLVGVSGWGTYVASNGVARVYLSGGNGAISTSGSVYAATYYDTNTAYYGDFASNSVFNTVTFSGGTLSGTLTMNTQKALVANNYGRGVYGLYASTKFQHVWSMGTAYNLSDDGSTTGNLYGLCWSYPSAGGAAANLNTHGLMVINNGGWDASLASSTRAGSDMRAPIYYDLNNTGYFLNPSAAGGNSLKTIGDWRQNTDGWSGEVGGKMQYHGSNWYIQAANSFIYRNSAGANQFYVDNTGTGAITNYLTGTNSLRAPIFYDSNNTAYYINPAGINSSSFEGVSDRTRAQLGLSGGTWNSGSTYMRRPNYTTDTKYWTGAMGWSTVDMNTVASWGSGFVDSWSSPANAPSGSSHWVGTQVFHYNNGSTTNYGWQLVSGGGVQNLRFRQSWPTFTAWRTVPVLDVNNANGGAMYAGIYYDSDNTANYVDPAGTSRLLNLDFGVAGYYLKAGSWGVRNQTPYGYIEFGPANSSYGHIYTDRPNFYMNAGLYINGGSWMRTGDIRSAIFYDVNNTAFYLDPSSTGTSLNVAGDVVAYASSDIRFKNNVTPITNALDKINKIGGYTFEWNEKSHKKTGKKDIGVIAQEVEEILPEIVDTRDNGYKAVDYSKLTALLIQSVKEQQVIIDSLKSRIETLENN